MKHLLTIFILTALFSACNQPSQKCEKEIYLLPPGFRGDLIVFFNQSDGQQIEYEDSARVYRIPEMGYLKSQFPKNGGCMTNERIKFFYEDSSGNRTPLDYFLNLPKDSIPKDRDYVLFTFLSNEDTTPDFVIHLVGSVYEFKDLTNSVRNLDPVRILENL